MKLTKAQHEALVSVLKNPGEGSYGLRTGMRTLEALESRKLVSAKRGLGSMAFPQTSIKWHITDAGRAALNVS